LSIIASLVCDFASYRALSGRCCADQARSRAPVKIRGTALLCRPGLIERDVETTPRNAHAHGAQWRTRRCQLRHFPQIGRRNIITPTRRKRQPDGLRALSTAPPGRYSRTASGFCRVQSSGGRRVAICDRWHGRLRDGSRPLSTCDRGVASTITPIPYAYTGASELKKGPLGPFFNSGFRG
jgi:hypothetical protein